ncbi:MAG: hypothetical protein H0U05_10315 [Actinobacteria bacterium]|nr:hypothetical protein [Actinomycetota bacterium]
MHRFAPWLIVALAALGYPIVVLAFAGAPAFPSRADCVLAPTGEGEYQVVFGYRDSELEALELRDQALAVGFQGTEISRDGCGRVRIAVDDIPSREVGEEVIREARTVDLDPTLERES